MTSTHQQWNQIRNDYLAKVEKALRNTVEHERRQILDDVTFHLNKRFEELSPDEQTWENMQTIITEMGPVEDYTDLLQEESVLPRHGKRKTHLSWIIPIFSGLLIAAGIGLFILSPLFHPPVGYIIHFSPSGDFAPATPRELLTEFNNHHPPSVSTSYFRTEPVNGKLIGSIFTKTKPEKELLTQMLNEVPTLNLINAQAVNTKQLEDHKARKQLSLPSRPRVLKTFPATLVFDIPPDTSEISVTFDQPMMNFSWSWVGGGEHYPETTAEPKYDKDRMTCTLPVKLKPGQWYWIGINSEKYVYFQTEKHIPAEPYVILFATTDENGNSAKIPAEYIEEAKRINSK